MLRFLKWVARRKLSSENALLPGSVIILKTSPLVIKADVKRGHKYLSIHKKKGNFWYYTNYNLDSGEMTSGKYPVKWRII